MTINVEQIALRVTTAQNKATLNWSGARTPVDIYQNGVVIDTGPEAGTATYRYKKTTTFKGCETNTNYCSVEVTVQ